MSKSEAAATATELLKIALSDIAAGNFWLAKSYLRDALVMSNKAGDKRRAGFIMLAMQRVTLAAKA